MRTLFFVTAVILLLWMRHGFSQEEGQDIPAGMEKVTVGRGAEVVVPKGARVTKRGDLVVLESANEYVGRKVSELEERLEKIEKDQKELRQKMEVLAKALSDSANQTFASSPNGGE